MQNNTAVPYPVIEEQHSPAYQIGALQHQLQDALKVLERCAKIDNNARAKEALALYQRLGWLEGVA